MIPGCPFLSRPLCFTADTGARDFGRRTSLSCFFGFPIVLSLLLLVRSSFCPSASAVMLDNKQPLVVRIARPTSLAIWHCRHSHRRPNSNGSPNRRHFASLDLKEHAYFSHRRPTSQAFRRRFFWHFPVLSDQANVFSHR